jgi:hypothetical protein
VVQPNSGANDALGLQLPALVAGAVPVRPEVTGTSPVAAAGTQ